MSFTPASDAALSFSDHAANHPSVAPISAALRSLQKPARAARTYRAGLREVTPDDLRTLQHATGYPLVSVLVSTAPDLFVVGDDITRIERMLDRTAERLAQEMAPADIARLLAAMRSNARSLMGERTSHGIALFGSDRGCVVYRVVSPIDERVVIDPTFATRDLARSLAENPPYRLLVMGHASARLLVGSGERLREITDVAFPLNGRVASLDRRRNRADIQRKSKEAHDDIAFVRRVGAALAAHQPTADLPLFAVASTPMLAALKRHCQVPPLHVVTGSHERTTPGRLAALVRPAIDAHLADAKDAALHRLESAQSVRRGALGVQHVWTAAQRKSIELLLVDQGFRYPAWTTMGGRSLVRAFTVDLPDVLDDAVDEIIEMTQRSGGSVCFVRPGELGEDRIAAIISTH